MIPESLKEYGGKGANLQKLSEYGFRVPNFFVLTPSFFSNIDAAGDSIAEEIENRLHSFRPGWKESFENKLFAVRSSASAEDQAAHSFAGQFKTYLNVPITGLPEAIHKVLYSVYDAEGYVEAKGIEVDWDMAVIVQEMVPATAAGVAFSVHPVNGTEEVVVNAVSGLGDKLVDGSENADSYTVFRNDILQRNLVGKESVLTDGQILELAETAKAIEKSFGGPQDIEFAFEEDTLYILQTRPITTLSRERIVWDNSNIVESYPGLTLPLTDSFIRNMYAAVYRQFSAILGISERKMTAHDAAFDNMLGLLNGRVYYNLNSWFQVLSLLPGYSLNAGFMEKMMGVKEKPDIPIEPSGNGGIKAWWEVLGAVRGITQNLRTARKGAADFVKAFNRVYKPFAQTDFGKQSVGQIWEGYKTFEALMLREWKAPLVNDFFAMIFFGLLQKQCAKIAPEDPTLANRLLAASDAVLTTEPIRQLPRILVAIQQYPALLESAQNDSPEAFYTALQSDGFPEARQQFNTYVERWGERTVAELKLETVTYQQDPLMLVRLLQSQLISGNSTANTFPSNLKESRQEAEDLVAQKLRGKFIKRRLFNYILRRARYFVSQRENLRYYRTRGFGMVRRMMLALGEKLAAQNVLDAPRDVFYLSLSEVESLVNAPKPMQTTVAARKAQYEAYETASLPERVIAYGEPRGVIRLASDLPKKAGISGNFTGIPCSPGVVRARIRKVTYADALQTLNGDLLATYATDPGFVVLFATASGILTERGSLLSHAAIVSREMGIPCIVGIDGLMDELADGTLVEMNGSTGVVKVVDETTTAT